MSNDDCQLSDGVTYEALPENEFTRQIPSFSRGFVRLQPYNQVGKVSVTKDVWKLAEFLDPLPLVAVTHSRNPSVPLSAFLSTPSSLSADADVSCECSLMNGSNARGAGLMGSCPKFQVFPKCFLPYQKRLKEFECRDDDVWVASFPKCGELSRGKADN